MPKMGRKKLTNDKSMVCCLEPGVVEEDCPFAFSQRPFHTLQCPFNHFLR